MTITASLSFSYTNDEQSISPRCGSVMTYNVGDDARKQHRLLMLVWAFLWRYQHLGSFRTHHIQCMEKKLHTIVEY